MRQTDAQKQASDPQASVWVAASAGTGKTFVLTARVLRLMLGGTSPDKILCLTFTKAAAAEMANRLRSRLGEWAVCDDQKLIEDLNDLMGQMPDQETCLLARKLFATVLDVPGGLKIQTIHSFCQSLLGRFPLEARIAPHFQVMDERTALDLLYQAREVILGEARAEANPALAGALAHISRQATEHVFADLISELTAKRGSLENIIRRYRIVKQAALAQRRMLGIEVTENADTILSAAVDVQDGPLKHAAQVLLDGTKTDQTRGQAIADWLAAPDQRTMNFSGYSRQFLKQDGEIFARLITKKLSEDHPDVTDTLFREAQRLQEIDQRLKALALLENSEALLTLGTALIDAYGAAKRRHAVLDYDDLIFRVTGLLRGTNAAEWVLYKLDGGLDHILIDEAQDTNPEQWQVVRALAGEFYQGDADPDLVRTLFAVGDVKQSIYSFQRADPQEFVGNRAYFSDQAAMTDRTFHAVNLDLSFRSTAAVLGLVDRVFDNADSRYALSFSDELIAHQPSRVGEAGRVELWPTIQPDIVPETEDWSPPVIQQPARKPERRLAEKIADQIKSWIDTGETLISKGRSVTAGDVLILVRRRSEFDDYMIRALKARNIPVAGQDRMKLSEQLAVMDLLAVGHFVMLPADDLTLAVVLKSPLIGFPEERLYELAYGRPKNQTLWSCLLKRRDENPDFARAADYLSSLTNMADFMPPFDFYNQLLGPLRGREMLLARLGEEAHDPIDEFLALALGYEQNNISALQGFLHWFETGDREIKRDMEQENDQVRIMTIHGAKGLQAPIVFLPDTCQLPTRDPAILWPTDPDGDADDEMMFWPGNKDLVIGPCQQAKDRLKQIRDQEYQRLLYVALTRAEDRLYITGWEGKKGIATGSWYDKITNVMSEMTDVRTEQDAHGDDILVFDNAQTKDVEQKQTVIEEVTIEALPNWAQAMPAAEPIPSQPLSPSRPVDEDPAVQSPLLFAQAQATDQRRFHRGRIIHRLLEILPDVAVENRQGAARSFLAQPAHDLTEADQQQISQEVLGILANDEFAELFGADSQSEVSVVGMAGSMAVSGQVDRLVVRGNEILIVDYKTNRPPPKEAAKIPTAYVRQMAAYERVLKEIYQDHHIRSLLLWTDTATLMEVPPEMITQIHF